MTELKKAREPFVFHTSMRIHEATGRRAKNITELLEGIREEDGSVIFYHTYGSQLRYHFMVPAPVSDFDFWVEHTLHDKTMAEKLSGIDTLASPNIHEIRDAHIKAIETHLGTEKCTARAKPGDEFYFVKANSFVLPMPYQAHDLGEFRDSLALASIDSIFFHLFEARLRLHNPTNDFSFWLGENLGEFELAAYISRQDPYVMTLDQVKANMLEAIDRRLKESGEAE